MLDLIFINDLSRQLFNLEKQHVIEKELSSKELDGKPFGRQFGHEVTRQKSSKD